MGCLRLKYEDYKEERPSLSVGYKNPILGDGGLSAENFAKKRGLYTDHLGNGRVWVKYNELTEQPEVIQQADYYPFGLVHDGKQSIQSGVKNQYTYNGSVTGGVESKKSAGLGMEFVEDLGLNIHHAYYRTYDPAIGRLWQIDPKAEQSNQIGLSPYNAFNNNPSLYADPNGDIIPNLIGGGVAGGTDYAVQVGIGLAQGKGFAAFTDVSRSDIAISMAVGFATSGTSTLSVLSKVPSVLKSKTVVETAVSTVESVAKQASSGDGVSATQTATDVIGDKVGGEFGDKLPKVVSPDKIKTVDNQLNRAKRVSSSDPTSSGRQEKVADLQNQSQSQENINNLGSSAGGDAAQETFNVSTPTSNSSNSGSQNNTNVIDISNYFPSDNTSTNY